MRDNSHDMKPKWIVSYYTPKTNWVDVWCASEKAQIRAFKKRRKELSESFNDYQEDRIGDEESEENQMLLKGDTKDDWVEIHRNPPNESIRFELEDEEEDNEEDGEI